MMVFIQNELENSGGNPIYGHPGVQIHKFWPKMTPNIGIMQIIYQFGPFDNAK